MDMIMDFMTPLTVYHWLAIGIILIGIEMTVGTFDLLWIGTAALLTALIHSGLIPLPEAYMGWQAQLITFAVLAVTLVVAGRTVFAGLRKPSTTHPELNKRSSGLVGSRAVVAGAFAGGVGRVKIGDTTWSAESESGADFADGTAVVVSSANGTVLKVRAA